MTIRENIIQYLQAHPNGVDDDSLSEALALKSRQQANMRCRALAEEGLVIRRVYNGKIHNFWAENTPKTPNEDLPLRSHNQKEEHPWFWEGNVQASVVRYLVSQN